ncbi:uncharacterized protein LOC143569678 [Bidens hawaiensis]|uniref:uncharacterized protein LOC143569678 n=1 Tax=Bidens hawaiensis TaxID=980011 RepID=UPI00404B5371
MDYRSQSLEEDVLVNTQGGVFSPNSDRKREIPKSQKTRWLSDIYKELEGSSDDLISSRRRKMPSRWKKLERKEPGGSANEDSETSDFSSESDYDSSSFTRVTLNRNRRVVSQRTSKSGIRILGTSSKRLIRKTRTAVAPSSLGDEENTSRTSEADTLPMVATEEQVKGKGLCELEGRVPTAIGSGLAQDKETKYGNLVCKISRNPAEFSTEEAKKYMRGLKKLP